MSVSRFREYAAAFEEAYRTDDWSVLEPFFTSDASYAIPGEPPFGKLIEGRENVIQGFKQDVDSTDRRFDVRIVEFLERPREEDGVVRAPWRAVYQKEGVPDLVLQGVEKAHFKGDKIQRLISELDEEQGRNIMSWMEANAAAVGIGE